MNAELSRALARALGSDVRSTRALGGGSINEAYCATLADGRQIFVKSHTHASAEHFACEARGLRWLAEAQVIRVPEVLAIGTDVPFLALEYIESGRRRANFDELLGHRLALLHQSGAHSFGFSEDNVLATLHQSNTPHDSWADFYGQERLLPQVVLAVDSGTAPRSWHQAFEALLARLDALVGPAEPPARLHGDLWSGNVHSCENGEPVLVDPAVYGGHREIDLAMLQLFGAPGSAFFSAYDEIWPLDPGYEERVPLYQLYPLLAHVNLFGRSYVGSVEAALRRYL